MKNTIKISFFVLIILLFTSCSGYSQYYKPFIKKDGTNVEFIKKNEEPKLIRSNSNNIENDIFEIISNHYIIMGVSSFIGYNQERELKSFAKSIGAFVVLYFTEYVSTRQMTIFIPTTETSAINLNTYSGTKTFNTYGAVTKTTNQPYSYSFDKYKHNAVFFARDTSKKRFGIFYKSLTNQMRKKLQRNDGILVGAVYKETPAFNANILSDDLIISINGIEVGENNFLNFLNIINGIPSGKQIKVVLLRDGQEKTLYMVLE
ncbi:MAG: PDZ domain-containing protein [Campylobacteraceae bacterium]|nr:PDZ domain-containing protein [Campylobacteraceae bacterium]